MAWAGVLAGARGQVERAPCGELPTEPANLAHEMILAACTLETEWKWPILVNISALAGRRDNPDELQALMDIWNATNGPAWGDGNAFNAEWLDKLGFQEDGQEGAGSKAPRTPSPFFQMVSGGVPGTSSLGLLLARFLPNSSGRYLNGFPWGTPGVSYCLWQGVSCCMRYEAERAEDLQALWDEVGNLDSWEDMEREPLRVQLPENSEPKDSYELVFAFAKSNLRESGGIETAGPGLARYGLFNPLIDQALTGLTEAGFAPRVTKSCTHPFSVKALDLSAAGLEGSLPESLGDLSRLTLLDVSNNPKLVGPLPETVARMGCLGNVEMFQTRMNCKNPRTASRDCPLPVYMYSGRNVDAAKYARAHPGDYRGGLFLGDNPTGCGQEGSTLNFVQKITDPFPDPVFIDGSIGDTCPDLNALETRTLPPSKFSDNRVIEADPAYFNYKICQCPEGYNRKEVIEEGAVVGVYCVKWIAWAIATLCVLFLPGIIIIVALLSVAVSWRSIQHEMLATRFDLIKKRTPPGMLPRAWTDFVHSEKVEVSKASMKFADLTAWFGACGLFSGGMVNAQCSEADGLPLPVTIVISDIEGSTEMWESTPKGMQKACDMHDKIVRKAAAAFFGYEITTEGDSFTFAFHEVSDACAFCLHVQRELMVQNWPKEIYEERRGGAVYMTAGETILSAQSVQIFHGLRVRMGVATGVPSRVRQHKLTRRWEYMGEVVWRARSVSEVPVGGQILLDSTTATLLGNIKEMDRVSVKITEVRHKAQKGGNSVVRALSAIVRGLRHRFSPMYAKQGQSQRVQGSSQYSHGGSRWSPFSSPRMSPRGSPRAHEEGKKISAREANVQANALLKTIYYDAMRAHGFLETFLGNQSGLKRLEGVPLPEAVFLSHGSYRLESTLFHLQSEDGDTEELVELLTSELLGRVLHFDGVANIKQTSPGFLDAPGGFLSMAFLLRGGIGIIEASGEQGCSTERGSSNSRNFSDWSDGSYELRHAGSKRKSEEHNMRYRTFDSPSFRKHRKAHSPSRSLQDYLPDMAFVAVTPNFEVLGRMESLADREAVLAGFNNLLRTVSHRHNVYESKIRQGAMMAFRYLSEAASFCMEIQAVLQRLKLTQIGEDGNSDSLKKSSLKCDIRLPDPDDEASRSTSRNSERGGLKKIFFGKVQQRDGALSASCAVWWGGASEVVPDRFTGRAVFTGKAVADCVTLVSYAIPGSILMPRLTARALLVEEERSGIQSPKGRDERPARLIDIGVWRLKGMNATHSLVQLVQDPREGSSSSVSTASAESRPPLALNAKRLSEGAGVEVGAFRPKIGRVDWNRASVDAKMAARNALETLRVADSFKSRRGLMKRWKGSQRGHWWWTTGDL